MKTKNIIIPIILISISLGVFYSCEKEGQEDEGLFQTFDYSGGTIKMIWCPGGTFLTNDDDNDLDFEDGPEVTVDPFWISEMEVTNDMVQNILSQCNGTLPNSGISSGSSIFRQENINAHNYLCEDYVKWGWQFLIYLGGSEFYGFYDIIFDQGFHCRSGQNNHPCTDITWYGAIMMCNWITGNSSNTGRQVYSGIETDDEWWDDETICNFNRTGFRLPTTAEWECAARWQGNDNSGDCYEYPTGSGQYWTRGGCASGASAPTSNVNATAAVAVYEYDSDGYTNPDDTDKIKGNRQPNKLGLYDMSGNVWEWCFDDAGRFIRVIRGGGAQSKHHDVRISSTSYYPADGTASDLGFRLVMSAGN